MKKYIFLYFDGVISSKNYSTKAVNNQCWIWKDFNGNLYWDNASGIKDLLNGKTLNDFSIMFDEAIDFVKGLDI